MSNNGVAARLKQIRTSERYSQAEFAALLNIPLRSYCNYERGERDLPASALIALYETLLVDPIWVMTGTPLSAPPIPYPRPPRHAILSLIRA